MKPIWTIDQITDQLTRWDAAWDASQPIIYSFYTSAPAHHGYVPGFSAFSAAQRASLARTMQLVSDIVPIDFTQLPSNGGQPGWGNERIGFFNLDSANHHYWGEAEIDFPSGGGRIVGADVEVNLHRASVQGGWAAGDSNSRKLMHELLHTLGLPHPGEYNGDSALSYENEAEYMQDSNQYSVMSYWLAEETGADHFAGGRLRFAATPLLHDIAALQALYGADMTTRTGDTVYGFHSTAGRAAYNLSDNPHLVFAIWDAGGADTLDLSGYSTGARIDLREGAFSDAGAMTKNIAIAYGAVIEHAIGGSGNDLLTGNAAANRLNGRGGADRMSGGLGDDIYIVDQAGDRASEGSDGGGVDGVKSYAGYTLGAGIENLFLLGSAAAGTGNGLANRIIGNAAANLLAGERGDDAVGGGGGGDQLFGGLGNDRLTGGAGRDSFAFDTTLNRRVNVDTILDFAPEDDVIRLDRAVFTAIAADGRLAPAAFREGGAALDASDRILYVSRTGQLFYDPDGDGAAAAILFARVDPGTALTNADFAGYG